MAQYDYRSLEKKWQQYWDEHQTYRAEINIAKPKFYALDMFPYPSGAGLHVGHPLGYIASDVVARYKKLKGFNVLHPMGFDAFGLPAEQYAIQTGQHPAITTAQNISRYKEQLRGFGFSFDWDKEVQTSDPSYYKWTQWIFVRLFKSWYNNESDKAEPIDTLIRIFEAHGNEKVNAVADEDTPAFTLAEWNAFSEVEKQRMLLKYRLAYLANTIVNWCPELGTVLSNDEVKDGFSERGGFPVIRKDMLQWNLRITAYADRLLSGLDTIDWPEPLKEMQRNWIGKSLGAELAFKTEVPEASIKVFTTRIDTIFGVTFLVLAPEHELVETLTTANRKAAVTDYVEQAKNRSERDRMSDVKTISGEFTGSYAIHPFSGDKIPVWVADYVLIGYGTGAVMAVPAGDQRDYAFAKHFNLPIIPIIEGTDVSAMADPTKTGTMINSGFINGMEVKDATLRAIEELEKLKIGKAKTNFRIRDAIFGRQRYWGEPIPAYFDGDIPYVLDESELPLTLPEVDAYKPTEAGEPPLGRATNWQTADGKPYELTTMPGWAGSSWYFFRYMDPHNEKEFVSKEAQAYWKDVDLYIGGAEHATGHLLYSRFWTKFLYDRGWVNVDEYAKKLINQGMIQGISEKICKFGRLGSTTSKTNTIYFQNELGIVGPEIINNDKNFHVFVSYDVVNSISRYQTSDHYVLIDCVTNNELDINKYLEWRADPEFADAVFVTKSGYWQNGSFQQVINGPIEDIFKTKPEVEKMSKSKYNVVNPDDVIAQYGADTLRMYEMFLGPLEQSKPWNTNGIDGVNKFLRKLWRLFHNDDDQFAVSDAEPTAEELKILHRTIKKTEDDIASQSFNTSVSSFMICVNELSSLQCNKRKILTDLVVILSPYAPHIAEELWQLLGNSESVTQASFPAFQEKYLIEQSYEYPISINGKVRAKMNFALDMPVANIEREVLASEKIQKWLEGKTPKKVIIVPKKIVNIVI